MASDHSSENSLEKRAHPGNNNNNNNNDYVVDDKHTIKPTQPPSQADTELAKLFYLNTTTGHLFTTSTDMPCSDCTLLIQYKANDVGRFKTRVSRKSSIKLHIRPFPVSLFKSTGQLHQLDNDEAMGRDEESSTHHHHDDTSAVELTPLRTFDCVLPGNKTDQQQRIILTLNEDVKLGEKVYQLKTRPIGQLGTTEKPIIYFTLLEASNTNHTFYMANHDGSLYLIKPLDCDDLASARHFNLTVLVTNWLGQNELVSIEVNVRDVNDNRPRFVDSSISLNQTLRLSESGSDHALIDLTTAHDADNIDRGKLEFKIENCFYLGRGGLLIKKSTTGQTYPLCGAPYIDLLTSPQLMNAAAGYAKNSQLVRLKLRTRHVKTFLHNASNFHLSCSKTQYNCLVSFVFDISVRDTSLVSSSSLTRVHLDLTLIQDKTSNSKVFKRDQEIETINIFRQKPTHFVQAGFKRDEYHVFVRELTQLRAGSSLIRLNDEFVWLDRAHSHYFNSFQPYDLHFFIISSSFPDLLTIEPNFGTIYLNRSLLDQSVILLNSGGLFQVSVGCRLVSANQKFLLSEEQRLFTTTSVTVSLAKSAVIEQAFARVSSIPNMPVWVTDTTDAFVDENSPTGTGLSTSRNVNKVIRASDFVNTAMIDRVNQLLLLLEPSELVHTYSLVDEEKGLFSIEPTTGYIRVLFKPDFEETRVHQLAVRLCITAPAATIKPDELCFKQLLQVNLHVVNVNDNEPKPVANSRFDANLNLSRYLYFSKY
jgi:hypothetical protein